MKIEYPAGRTVIYCDVCSINNDDDEEITEFCEMRYDDGCGYAWEGDNGGWSDCGDKLGKLWEKHCKIKFGFESQWEIVLDYVSQPILHMCYICMSENYENFFNDFQRQAQDNRATLFKSLEDQKLIPEFDEKHMLIDKRQTEIQKKLQDIYLDLAGNQHSVYGVKSKIDEAQQLQTEFQKLNDE